ncbi:MAG: TrkH family potassium uptake protein [Sporomusaceae bacterium]|nr:TrkH family potassium uptake protein [Sporomusaceae bacterium]
MQMLLVAAILGRFLCAFAVYMGIPAVWAGLAGLDCWRQLAAAAALTGGGGALLLAGGKSDESVGIREGFAIVAGAWGFASLFGALPYLFTGVAATWLDAFFESVSGLTTTGATVIQSLEAVPAPVLLWRSMTQWLGGMGIIVLFIVFLPQLGVGAFHLFKAEVPGPVAGRVVPHIRDTAGALWKIYLFLTLSELGLLMLAGMNFFDALNYALATVATGGFATADAGVQHYDSPLIEGILTVFMIIAGANFTLFYLAWRRGVNRIFADSEVRAYLAIIAAATLLITANLTLAAGQPPVQALRDALFQVASLITSTGFVSTDFDQWPPLSKLLLLLLMFIGGCSGSTAGAIKVSRLLILCKQSWAELRKAIHPRIVTSIQLDGRTVDTAVITAVSQFFFIYLLLFSAGVLVMAGTGMQPFDAMGAVAAALGNVGTGFGVVGPTTTYSSVAPLGKLVLSICMLLGRLELITLLVFLRAEFWRSHKGW